MRSLRFVVPAAAFAFVAPAWAQSGQPSTAETSVDHKVTLAFKDTSLEIVIAALQKTAPINLVVDPSVDARALGVTAEVRDGTVGAFLDQIQAQHGLARTVWCGAIVLHTKDKGPGAEPAAPTGDAAKRLLRELPSVEFGGLRSGAASGEIGGVRFSDAMGQIKTRTNLDYDLSSRVRAFLIKSGGGLVRLELKKIRLDYVLNHMTRAVGLTWSVQPDGKVAFAIPEGEGTQASVDTLDFDARRAVEGGGLAAEGAVSVDIEREVKRLSNPVTREAASRILARQGKPACTPLARALKDADPATAQAILETLAAIKDPSEYAAVLAVFNDTERSLDLRTVTGNTLGAMKAPEAVPDLIAALNDNWFRISETARNALISIGSPAVGPLQDAFLKAAREPQGNDGVVYRALLVFGAIGDEAAKGHLQRAIQVTRGPRAIPIRHHAAIGLGLTNDPAMIEPLIVALEREKNFRVAKYIERSLTWLTGEEALGPQGERWRNWWEQEGKAKFLEKRSADELLGDLAGGEIQLPVDEKGFAILETPAQRLARLIKDLCGTNEERARAAEFSLVAMGDDALTALKQVEATGTDAQKKTAQRVMARIAQRDLERQ